MQLEEIKAFALEHKVPIMSDESLDTISSILKNTNSRSLLEIGTAVAYSTLYFADKIEDIEIDTVERDPERFLIAQKNVESSNYKQRITCIQADALKYNVMKSYDAIIIDAAKAQNDTLFRLYFAYTNYVMIIDNIDFHGFTGHSQDIKKRNLRQMVARIERFLDYINSRDDLIVERINVGDGLMVIQRKWTR